MSLDDMQNQVEDEFDFSAEDVWGEIKEKPKSEFLGMTPGQRFVLSLLLFLTTAIISVLCLLVAGKIALPF
jgi:hypothetical protein